MFQIFLAVPALTLMAVGVLTIWTMKKLLHLKQTKYVRIAFIILLICIFYFDIPANFYCLLETFYAFFCLALFTEKLIDGINQSQARRRALMLFCLEYHNASARVSTPHDTNNSCKTDRLLYNQPEVWWLKNWWNSCCCLKDALMLSIDRKGFDILAKVPEVDSNQNQQYNWKEFRFTFKEEASDIESFCRLLVELEEEALESVKSYSGLG